MARSKVRKSRLSNGITLITESVVGHASLALGVWVRAGSRTETKSEQGLSHFLEHMMFKGTSKRTALQIATAIERVGGEFNAFTGREYTCFHVLLLAADLPLAVDVVSDILQNSTFDSTELEREKKVVLQEMAMVEDAPEEYAFDMFFEQAFGTHPLGRNILGTEASINAITRRRLVSYFQRHYQPKDLVITVAGNVSHERVRAELIEKLKLKPKTKILNVGVSKGAHRSTVRGGPAARRVPRLRKSVVLLPRPADQAQVILGFPAPSAIDANRFAAHLLSSHLGGGMSSILFQEIREKRGLAYSVYSTLLSYSDCGLLAIYVGADANDVPQAIRICIHELKKVAREGIEGADLRSLRMNMINTLRMNDDSIENRMGALARSEIYLGKDFSKDQAIAAIEKTTSADIQKLAQEMFRAKNAVVTVLGDERQIRKALLRESKVKKANLKNWIQDELKNL